MANDPQEVDPIDVETFAEIGPLLYRYPMFFGAWPEGRMTDQQHLGRLRRACLSVAIRRFAARPNDDNHVLDEDLVPRYASAEQKRVVLAHTEELRGPMRRAGRV